MNRDTGQIKAVGPAYAAVLAALHVVSFPVAECWHEAAMLELLHSYGVITGLVVREEKPAGFVMLRCIAGEAEILTLCVAPYFQNLGIGSQLIIWAIQQAKQAHSDTVFLEVSSINEAAKKLYKKYGFIKKGLRKNYYHDDSDAFVMSYTIKENAVR